MSQDGSRTRRGAHNDGALQFDVAEPAHSAASDAASSAGTMVCQRCRRAITTSYYEVHRAVVCPRCREELERAPAGSRSARAARALGLGFLAAVAGSVLYYAIAAATGYEIGIVAIAVGYGVGRAVRKGSGGRGGRTYQLLAVALTYFAIVSTYIPLAVREMKSDGRTSTTAATVRQAGTPGPASASGAGRPTAVGAPADSSAAPHAAARAAASASRVSAGVLVVGMLVLFGIAAVAPFMAGASNLIGLLIIGIALYEAWKLNRRLVLQFTGPYDVSVRASPARA